MSNDPNQDITDADITSDPPTERDDDLDKGGEGEQDTGDEPTESDDDLDKGGEGEEDTGDR